MDQEPFDPASAAREQLQLAVERTYLAHERNLMAWTRTATSLITFGLVMIGIGVTLLMLATIQHWWEMRRLRTADHPYSHFPFALILAGLVTCLGIMGFAAAILN